MSQEDNRLIFIFGMIDVLAILFVAPIIDDILGIEFSEEIILFFSIFVGASLYRRKNKHLYIQVDDAKNS